MGAVERGGGPRTRCGWTEVGRTAEVGGTALPGGVTAQGGGVGSGGVVGVVRAGLMFGFASWMLAAGYDPATTTTTAAVLAMVAAGPVSWAGARAVLARALQPFPAAGPVDVASAGAGWSR